MEKYLADTPPSLRQSRPADYSCDTAPPVDSDDDKHLPGRVTPALHVHHELPPSLRTGTATLPDVKPFRAINSDGKHSHLNLLLTLRLLYSLLYTYRLFLPVLE